MENPLQSMLAPSVGSSGVMIGRDASSIRSPLAWSVPPSEGDRRAAAPRAESEAIAKVPPAIVDPPWQMLPAVAKSMPVPLALLSMTVTPPSAPLGLVEPIVASISSVLSLVSNVAPPARTSISLVAGITKPLVACKPPPSKIRGEPALPRYDASLAATNPPWTTKAPVSPELPAPLKSSVPSPIFTRLFEPPTGGNATS